MENRWKRKAIWFLAVAAMAAAIAMESFAAAGRIAFSDPTAKVGDDVSVTIKFSTLDGSALGNTDVMLAYDTTILEYINETENANGGAGAIRVWSAPTGASEAATVLRFKALKAGTTSITVTSYEAYDNNGGAIQVEKQGSSAITINALETSSDDSRLQSLQVSPGSLNPSFSPNVRDYAVTVGLDTPDLTVSAVANNEKATVQVEGASGLQEGENTVVCHVTAEDGTSSSDYTITVTKVEGGEQAKTEAAAPEILATLDVTAKKIRIITKPESVEVPEGFRESSIAIGDTKVPGWTWAADESPRYCVFYGMNENGEQNFYRYDLAEKTVQRYFMDQASPHTEEEYDTLAQSYNALVDDYGICRILMYGFIAIAVILFILLIISRIKASGRTNDNFREGADTPVSRRGRRKSSSKGVSGRKMSKEERYMRGEDDEYEDSIEEFSDEEPQREYRKTERVVKTVSIDSSQLEEELANNLAKKNFSAQEESAAADADNDNGEDFEFIDL